MDDSRNYSLGTFLCNTIYNRFNRIFRWFSILLFIRMKKILETTLHYMFFCHKRPDRSFFYNGKQFPICARCTGILLGYFIGIFYIIISSYHNYFIDIFLILPLIIDGTGQYYKKWESTNFRRFITGILAGISTIFLLRMAGIYGYNHGKYIGNILWN